MPQKSKKSHLKGPTWPQHAPNLAPTWRHVGATGHKKILKFDLGAKMPPTCPLRALGLPNFHPPTPSDLPKTPSTPARGPRNHARKTPKRASKQQNIQCNAMQCMIWHDILWYRVFVYTIPVLQYNSSRQSTQLSFYHTVDYRYHDTKSKYTSIIVITLLRLAAWGVSQGNLNCKTVILHVQNWK